MLTEPNQEKPKKTRNFPKCENPNCKNRAISDGWCTICHPDHRKAMKELGKLGGRPKKIPMLTLKTLPRSQPRTVDDVLNKIGDTWLYLEAKEISVVVSHAIFQGCELALKALEQKAILAKYGLKRVS